MKGDAINESVPSSGKRVVHEWTTIMAEKLRYRIF
jgi:hypothetical protein